MENQKIIIKQGWPQSHTEMAGFLDRNLDYDNISTALLKEKLSGDPNADPELCLTAHAGGDPVGFLYAVTRDIRGQLFGYIKLMAVDKSWRRKKIGSMLYEKAEQLLRKKGVFCIKWYDVPLNYFMPGLDPRYTAAFCFAQNHGFRQHGEAVNMMTDLTASEWDTENEEKVLKERKIEIRRARPNDINALNELLSEDWELWKNEVSVAMKDDPPSVHIALLKGNIRAFSVHNGNNKGTGWFGPMGTHPDMRGLGVGSILLKRCLADMKKQGHKQAVIPWVGPIAFYSHYVNARINRVFWRMEKVLNT